MTSLFIICNFFVIKILFKAYATKGNSWVIPGACSSIVISLLFHSPDINRNRRMMPNFASDSAPTEEGWGYHSCDLDIFGPDSSRQMLKSFILLGDWNTQMEIEIWNTNIGHKFSLYYSFYLHKFKTYNDIIEENGKMNFWKILLKYTSELKLHH